MATTSAVTARVHNFGAGPAAIPLRVLERIRDEMTCLPRGGCSILEISHRSREFIAILEQAQHDCREILSIPDEYDVLFIQGGGRLQFAMVPMNLATPELNGHYLVTGSWTKSAHQEAARLGSPAVMWDGIATRYDRLPPPGSYAIPARGAYVYFASNETIQGVQFSEEPRVGDLPLVCDASSDLMSRRIDVRRYGLIFACAQKNLGPAGVTLVIIRRDLLGRSSDRLPAYLSYAQHAKENSLLNTAPTFAIYVVGLVARWLLDDIGGLAAMEEINRRKARLVYAAIDGSGGFYRGHAVEEFRSITNVTFRLPDEMVEKRFLAQAAENQLSSLAGHRSVGGVRASLYNALPEESARELADFMTEFARVSG